MCVTPVPTLRPGERITTAIGRTVPSVGYPLMSSRVAVLIPLRLLRKLRSISTAKPNLLPNPYSHNTWIKNGGIPREFGFTECG